MAVFAVFDVETTGLSAARGDRVVEIAAVILDEQFRVLRIFDSLVYPNRTIPGEVSRIHGISNQHVRHAPRFADLIPELLSCLTDVTHLVAHNVSFDLGFLKAELWHCGLEMPPTFGRLCTMQMARRKSVASNARLASVAAALRIPSLASAHRAMVDAGVTARILSLLHETDVAKADDPIQWPGCQTAQQSSEQRPRENLSVSLHRLAQMGLRVAAPSEADCGH